MPLRRRRLPSSRFRVGNLVTGSDPGSFGAAPLSIFPSSYLAAAAALAAIVAVICSGWGKRKPEILS